MKLLAILFCFLLLVGTAQAQDTMMMLTNTHPRETSWLYGECSKSPDGKTLECSFTQLMVRKKPSDFAKHNSELDALLKDPRQAAEAIESMRKDFCADEGRRRMTERIAQASDTARPHLIELGDRIDRLCRNPTVESYRALFRLMVEQEARTCKIAPPNSWKETFTRNLLGKWVSNRGPSGVCGLVNISTLEAEPLFPEKNKRGDIEPVMFWTYESRKVVTNRDAPICKDLDEAPYKYVNKVPPMKALACEILETGW